MKKYVKRIVEEHSNLYVRLVKLNDAIYNKDTSHINKTDFANMCMQLAAMRQYERCLIARLNNAGVSFDNGAYHECVAVIATSHDNYEDKYDAKKDKKDNK